MSTDSESVLNYKLIYFIWSLVLRSLYDQTNELLLRCDSVMCDQPAVLEILLLEFIEYYIYYCDVWYVCICVMFVVVA